MGLTPLEYLDCFLDSPAFRENLLVYEKELEINSTQVKNLTRECRRLIQATEGKYCCIIVMESYDGMTQVFLRYLIY